MNEGFPPAVSERHEDMNPDDRFADIVKLVRNEALIEAEPSLQFLNQASLQEAGGSIYYGTGLTTPNAISIGLPFDTLGMILTAEKLRRAGKFDQVFHHIADTHAKTNEWIDPSAVDVVADTAVLTLGMVKQNLGLEAFTFVKSSSFDTSEEYTELVHSFDDSPEHEYVKREMADMEWYRTHADVRLKLGWIVQSKETEMGFDERRFDREYLRFHPGQMSFVYTKPGRTFDTSRPKVSPYISIENEPRLLLSPDTNAETVLDSTGDKSLGGARKHIESIVRLYESLYGNLGKIGKDGVTFESKVQTILDKCFGK